MLYQLKEVSVYFGSRAPAIRSLSLDIESPSALLVVGPTGSGKTTLLRLLYGDVKPSSGDIFFKEVNFKKISSKKLRLMRQISGFIQQAPSLVGDMTCFENILLPLVISGSSKEKAYPVCLELMADLRISYLRNKYPSELSLGERKLVTVARALIHNPEVIFADEPTENLDDSSKINVMEQLKKAAARNATVIVTTNDAVFRNYFTNAKLIYLKEGKIVND